MTESATIAEFGATVTVTGASCPSCGSTEGQTFYSVEGVPVHQVRLVRSREKALNCMKGDIRLRFCRSCGFVWNEAFDASLVSYHEDYESTQAVSPTFNRFHEGLARELVQRFELVGKEVFEIGCGQGEFLGLLHDLGVKNVRGFDPVLRDADVRHPSVELTKDWYSEAYAELRPTIVCSKMVMEHIPDPGRFLGMLRQTVGDRPEAVVFAMMPELRRILDLCSFWDIYYEHCAYFSFGSLARAFRAAGFDPLDLRTGFGDQYVLIEARPGDRRAPRLDGEESVARLAEEIETFTGRVEAARAAWSDWLRSERKAGRRVVVWGGGSKGVSFLTTLGIRDEIDLVVDINPKRHGTYIAGTGHSIVGPSDLIKYRPDVVLIMSPIYRGEIAASLGEVGIDPRLVSVEEAPWKT